MNYVPFVYLLTFKPTGQFYYGSHYANKGKRKAHPDNLWKTYFTSSKVVGELIKEHGKGAFNFEIRKTFATAEETLVYEHRFLKKVNAKKNPKFLNKSNGGKNWSAGEQTDEHKAKGAASRKGLKRSDIARENISKGQIGCVRSLDAGKNISLAQQNMSQEDKDSRSNKMKIAWVERRKIPQSEETSLKKSNAMRVRHAKRRQLLEEASSKGSFRLYYF